MHGWPHNLNMRFNLNSLGLGSLYTSVLSFYLGQESSSVTHEPALPPSYPLAVRNPYLSAWMPSDRVQQLPSAEPQFWAGQELGWSVIVRVNGQAYSLMGVPDPEESDIRPATVHRAEFTATHSIFDLTAGYLTVHVCGARGQSIQVYSDIDARWTGRESRSQRDFEEQDGLIIYSLTVKDAPLYAEADDMALWGSAIFASRPSSFAQLSSLSGSPNDVRGLFAKDGELSGEDDAWGEGSVVALAHNLGKVTGGLSVNFVVGYEREAAINYLGEEYTGFYRTEYPTTPSALSFFLDDYSSALLESLELDRELSALSTAAGGPKYADILALSTRQAYGGIDLVIPNDSLDTGEVLAFIKELSSDGNINTIDVITPAFPIYYVMDPDYIRLLLEPVMKYLAAGRWHLPYTIHDLGAQYPHAIGHDDQEAEPMPIEECGNLLILAAAYVRATGDLDWTLQYMEVFQKYADYLVDNSINIADQLSSNDAAGPLANETNLAIKAAVGLKAFGEMSGYGFYSRVGEEHANILFQKGLGTDKDQTHFVLEYPDWPNTWKTPYNLFPDVLLGLETFSDAAYQMGGRFFTTVRGEYGVPLDNRQDWAKSDWNMWLAGTFETSTRDEFVDDLWSFMTNGKHNWPFSDRYVATSAHGNEPGVPILCRARPTPRPNFGAQGYPISNGAAAGPVPGATPLLPNNGRVIQSGPTRILCIADVRGNLKSLNELAKQARADHIIHTGDFGFYDDTSLERIADKTLKHVAQYSPLLPENVKRSIAQVSPQQSIKQRFPPEQLPLSELSMLLDKRITLDVPVYTVWGACEDVRVLEKFRSGEYKVDKLHIIDEANSRLLDIGGVKLRLLGLGGAVVMHKLFDNGEGKTTIAGGQGTMWTTLLQMGELIDTANRVYDPSETRVFVTHASPAREGMLNQLSVTLKADFSISAGLHFRYGSSYNEFSVNPSLDHYRGKLAASKASFNDVWETVKIEVEAAISSNDGQKTLLENALDVVHKMPSIANGGNPFGGPVAAGNAAGQVDESAFKNMWNFNLADAAFGYLVLEVEGGRIATEMRAQGFNFAHRTGKPQPGGAPQPVSSGLPATTASPAPTGAARTPVVAPQFGQAPPARAPIPQAQKGPRASPVPVIPKSISPQPPAAASAQPVGEEKTAAADTNGTAPHEKPSESPAPRGEKKPANALFVTSAESEQAVRDLISEEDRSKITKIEKLGKYNHVVTFSGAEEAKAALDHLPIELKKPGPTPHGQQRKPNFKFFEDRSTRAAVGNAGTWQSSTRGGITTAQRGYQSASDSDGSRRGGFGGRGRGGRGSGERGRGGRGGGRGGFKSGPNDSPAPSGDKPVASGDA
ncbi:protein of unknown function DUF1793 [Penicillium expansum]|uniref:DUF1793-domain-containing protein n=1 Tax=Penicillium expansum TaxID=27334 RepID=A0A0A2J8P2_PENEN|nr:protein of unknown function DUF1793 [Penicillium expansum]KGO51802.1 protein of unknown function DUF1793 [Penicillium expansum]